MYVYVTMYITQSTHIYAKYKFCTNSLEQRLSCKLWTIKKIAKININVLKNVYYKRRNKEKSWQKVVLKFLKSFKKRNQII